MTPDPAWRPTRRRPGGTPVTVVVDGRPLPAAPGDTVAAVMMLAGASFRRDRDGGPRAPLCNLGACFECAATVDGRPLTRTCLTPVREGMTVETRERR
ncbi:(2Fe-2S)-binding protein [Streptomyces zhihengii]|uniref:(2Fe-2S)-binding protein n=1 Tax=Streptomyces zhihengii TaxID=1818004 RepID=A0ABS2ULL8_9ACTN|nr:(2Fe-2S)-binding protein [Streptomyces zhihengii]MBM9618442.1 (2Fe-2S)-binding protein [Streptomyces zhihengii]